MTDQWSDILNDEEIDIIVEVMGGIEPARSYILEALNAKKNVVTANKDLLAEHGKELLDTAKANKRDLLLRRLLPGRFRLSARSNSAWQEIILMKSWVLSTARPTIF